MSIFSDAFPHLFLAQCPYHSGNRVGHHHNAGKHIAFTNKLSICIKHILC